MNENGSPMFGDFCATGSTVLAASGEDNAYRPSAMLFCQRNEKDVDCPVNRFQLSGLLNNETRIVERHNSIFQR